MRDRSDTSAASARNAALKPEIVERRRPQQVAEIADLRQRASDFFARVAVAVEIELDLHRRQRLPGLVVQLARNAPPLVLLRAQQ